MLFREMKAHLPFFLAYRARVHPLPTFILFASSVHFEKRSERNPLVLSTTEKSY